MSVTPSSGCVFFDLAIPCKPEDGCPICSASGMVAGTAETPQSGSGSADQPGPQDIAQPSSNTVNKEGSDNG